MDYIVSMKDSFTKFELVCAALCILAVLNLIWAAYQQLLKRPATTEFASVNRRELWIDILKVVSAFMIVLIHVSGSLYNKIFSSDNSGWFLMCVINAIPRFAVPCFLMITGTFSLGKGKHYNFPVVRKKVIRILIPLLFWSIMYIVARKVLWNQGNLIEEVLKIPFEKKDGSLWYAYQLIWLYLGMPFWQILWERLEQKMRRYFVLFTLGIPGVLTMAGELSLLGVDEYLPFTSIRPELCYVGMLFLGRMLYEAIFTIDRRRILRISSVCILAGLASMILGSVYLSINTNASAHNLFSEVRISGVLYGTGVFLAFSLLENHLAKFPVLLKKMVTALSRVSLGVYFSHCLMNWLLSDTMITGFYFNRDANVLSVLLCAVMSWGASSAMCILMSKLPILRKLVE